MHKLQKNDSSKKRKPLFEVLNLKVRMLLKIIIITSSSCLKGSSLMA